MEDEFFAGHAHVCLFLLDLRKNFRVPLLANGEETSFFSNPNVRDWQKKGRMDRDDERLSVKDDSHLLKSMPRSFALIYSSLGGFYHHIARTRR